MFDAFFTPCHIVAVNPSHSVLRNIIAGPLDKESISIYGRDGNFLVPVYHHIDENLTVTLMDCTITGNSASSSGGGITNGVQGVTSLLNTIVSENTAHQGGGIWNVGVLTVTDSTIIGNTAEIGGGISNDGDFYYP